jgi:hypothetical protein
MRTANPLKIGQRLTKVDSNIAIEASWMLSLTESTPHDAYRYRGVVRCRPPTKEGKLIPIFYSQLVSIMGKILLTGASGFIAAHCLNSCIRRG